MTQIENRLRHRVLNLNRDKQKAYSTNLVWRRTSLNQRMAHSKYRGSTTAAERAEAYERAKQINIANGIAPDNRSSPERDTATMLRTASRSTRKKVTLSDGSLFSRKKRTRGQ